MRKILLLLTFVAFLIGCKGGNTKTSNHAKVKDTLASFIEQAYKNKETDFKKILENIAVKNGFAEVGMQKYYTFAKEHFSNCEITHRYDEQYEVDYYDITAYPSKLKLGDYTCVTVYCWDRPEEGTVTSQIGTASTQLGGSVLKGNGEWEVGNWEPKYSDGKNQYGENTNTEVTCLELYANGHFIELSGVLRLSIDDCEDAVRLLVRDESKYVYRFDAISTNSSSVYLTDENDIMKFCNLLETKETLNLSFVNEQNESIGTMSLNDHEGGHIIGAIRQYIKEEKIF